MIKRLKRTVVLINMLLVGVIILSIFTFYCVNTYTREMNELKHSLNQVIDKMLHDNSQMNEDENGEFKRLGDLGIEDNYLSRPNDLKGKEVNRDSPMRLGSYVVVTLDENGNITDTQSENLSVDEEILKKCVDYAYKNNALDGQISEYSLVYAVNNINGTRISFADCSSVYTSLRNTVLISLLLFAASLIILFLISLGLSGIAVKPVKEAWEKQKQFVADASHELKTPLTVILANNNIMMSHTDSKIEDERQWLESTDEEAQHMKKLIDQMLFLAKSDAGTQNIQLSEVNLSEVVEGTALNFEPIAFEREILIDTRIEPDILLEGNSLQLNQLAHILIDNAVKYSYDKTTVTIRLISKGDNIEFSVNNIGNVISPDDIEHIFDRFYRAEKSRTTGGYGLGLSIARNIVKNTGGKLSVTSTDTDGTTFTAVFKRK